MTYGAQQHGPRRRAGWLTIREAAARTGLLPRTLQIRSRLEWGPKGLAVKDHQPGRRGPDRWQIDPGVIFQIPCKYRIPQYVGTKPSAELDRIKKLLLRTEQRCAVVIEVQHLRKTEGMGCKAAITAVVKKWKPKPERVIKISKRGVFNWLYKWAEFGPLGLFDDYQPSKRSRLKVVA